MCTYVCVSITLFLSSIDSAGIVTAVVPDDVDQIKVCVLCVHGPLLNFHVARQLFYTGVIARNSLSF